MPRERRRAARPRIRETYTPWWDGETLVARIADPTDPEAWIVSDVVEPLVE